MDSPRESTHSSILRKGYESFLVTNSSPPAAPHARLATAAEALPATLRGCRVVMSGRCGAGPSDRRAAASRPRGRGLDIAECGGRRRSVPARRHATLKGRRGAWCSRSRCPDIRGGSLWRFALPPSSCPPPPLPSLQPPAPAAAQYHAAVGQPPAASPTPPLLYGSAAAAAPWRRPVAAPLSRLRTIVASRWRTALEPGPSAHPLQGAA